MKLGEVVAPNDTFVTVLDDRDGLNALTQLGINSDGVDEALATSPAASTASSTFALVP